MVDRFHWLGHSACAKSYNPGLFSMLNRVNSSIMEQCNAALALIKGSVTRMTQVSFMLSVRFFLDAWNRKKVAMMEACARAQAQLPDA